MGKTTQRTEGDQWRVLRTYMPPGRKTIGKAALARFRHNACNKTGWDLARLDAWIAHLVSEKQVSTPALATPQQRAAAGTRAHGTSAEQQQAKVERGVRKWVAKNTRGHLSAAQMTLVKERLRGGCGSRKGVEMVVLTMEHHQDVTIEDRIQARGGHPRVAWRKEAVAWAREQGWVVPETLTLTPQIAPIRSEEVAIEMGSGWEGATEGLRKMYDRVITVDRKINTITRGERYAVPDLKMEFSTLANHPKGAVLKAAEIAGVRKGDVGAVWASPQCTLWTPGQAMNTDTQAKTVALQQRQEVERGAGLHAVLAGIEKAREADPTLQYCIEQPEVSKVKQLPEMAQWGAGVTVQACAYGERRSAKRYRLWLSPEAHYEFQPILPTGPRSQCEECKAGRPHTQAQIPSRKQRLAGTVQRVHIPGKTVEAANNRVPPALAEHVAWAMRSARLKMRAASAGEACGKNPIG
jgi:hypothetical protein